MTPFIKSHFLRLVRDLRAITQEERLRPDVMVGSVLAQWCEESFPGLSHSGLPVNPQLQRCSAVMAFVEFLKKQEFLESTYWLSSAYAQLTEKEQRKQLALYFTPPSLTNRLLDDLLASGVSFAARKFCDPACGGGAFLAPIAVRIRNALRDQAVLPMQILDHIQRHLLGFDKNGTLCELSKHFLLMALYDEVVVTGASPKFQIHQGDSLLRAQRLLGTLDVVICNPPFRKMSAAEVECYLDDFVDVIEAQPNLYTLFVALCVKLLAPNGTCALVTPTSYLSGRCFSKLRSFLMMQTTVLRIGMVSDRQGVFIDVEQETALTLVRREDAGHSPTKEAEVSVVARDGRYVDVGRCVLPNSGSTWPIPRSEGDAALLKSTAMSHATLADYGYVPRIGAFVWNRDTRTTYASARSAAQARGGTAVPLLWSSDILPNGRLRFTGYPKANREHCFVNFGATDHPSVVRRPSVILQRVTSNDQRRRLIAAPVPKTLINTYGGFVGENHIVILEQVSPKPALTPKQLVALLATPTVDRYFRCISGATNVSIFELSQLRLPDPGRLKCFLAQGYDMARAVRESLQEQCLTSSLAPAHDKRQLTKDSWHRENS